MSVARLFLLSAFLIACAATRAAIAQPQHTLLRTAGYRLQATLQDRPAPGATRKILQAFDAVQSTDFTDLTYAFGSAEEAVDALGHAHADLSATADVSFGSIRVSFDGNISASTAATAPDGAQGGYVEACCGFAYADFRDVWRMKSPSHPNSQLVTTSYVLIDGEWGVNTTGTPDPLNDGGIGLQVFVYSNGIVDPITPDVPNRIGVFNDTIHDAEPFFLPELEVFEDYPVKITKTLGENVLSDYSVGLRVSVTGLLHTDAGGDTVSSFFSGNFSHTLTWGGIAEVRDALTGELVTDWTLESLSGFDYARTIPEPTTFALLVPALIALRLRRWAGVGGQSSLVPARPVVSPKMPVVGMNSGRIRDIRTRPRMARSST